MSPRFVPAQLEILLYWIRAREQVRIAKEAGQPKPWTSDPHLLDWRWCNVRRLDDLVSRWLFDNWYGSSIIGDPVAAAALARLVNWPDSLADIAPGRCFVNSDIDSARTILAERAKREEKVFTGAYVVPGVSGKNKVDSVCDLVETVACMRREDTMKTEWLALTRYKGLGSFLAGQMVADMAHLDVGGQWPDRDTWAPIGPGSARGINRLLGRPKDKSVSQAEFEKLLPELSAIVRPEIAEIWTDRRLQAMDLQNCLCEFDKYRRLQLGEGTPRARYDGRAAEIVTPSSQGSFEL